MLTFLSLVVATFASEDLACIGAGLLIERGQVGAVVGVAACTVGIFAGDVGLWGLGRLSIRVVPAWPWITRRLRSLYISGLRTWLERHAMRAIVASRFLPGTRLPLYLLAGAMGVPAWTFSCAAFIGTLLWTPALVLLTVWLGASSAASLISIGGSGPVADLLVGASMLLLLRTLRPNARAVGGVTNRAPHIHRFPVSKR
jgi:membrane protein DedA with SNARE-associated domain